MSDRTMTRFIESLAREMVHVHGSAEKSISAFAKSVWEKKNLVRFLLMPYLINAEQELRAAKSSGELSKDQKRDDHRTQPNDGERGQTAPADKATLLMPRSPSASQLRASAEVHRMSAKTILDICKTSDGRAWGSIKLFELEIIEGGRIDTYIAPEVREWLGHDTIKNKPYADLYDLVPPPIFHQLKAKAERKMNAAS
jgi:hypothetical protein